MENSELEKNRSRVDNLPEWKQEWVREAAEAQIREYLFSVTKPKWKEIDQNLKNAHVEKNMLAELQEELEYRVLADKADLLEKYIRYAVKNVKQILANGKLLMECNIEGIGKGMMAIVPDTLAKALKNGYSKYEVAAQLFSGDLLMLDKYRSLAFENGQVITGFVNNRMGPECYEHQYQLAVVDGQRVVLNKTTNNDGHTLILFTNTPVFFNGEKSMRVEYMVPKAELERSRLSEIQITTSGKPYIRCKVDGVQQMRIQIEKQDKELYHNAKTTWGIKAAAELTKMFAGKYYTETLEQEINKTIKR